CNTGSLQCCQTTVDNDTIQGQQTIAGLLGVALDGITGLVGLQCAPIGVIAIESGNACNQTPICCNNNTYQGLINIGCVPIIIH
ncbi:hydrophobin, partial [Epithele typhae]|uniref:hydrophobin n=1 Tax=Epithele typhae TaxID=378194 RepID=UPI0020084947